jgi:hypothetical protein
VGAIFVRRKEEVTKRHFCEGFEKVASYFEKVATACTETVRFESLLNLK